MAGKNIMQLVYQVVAQSAAQGATQLAPADVAARLPFEPSSIREAFKRLRDDGILRMVEGSRARSELVPGAGEPTDNRGRRLAAARERMRTEHPLHPYRAVRVTKR
jgi:DNA-binding FadR family transcriptional regulator